MLNILIRTSNRLNSFKRCINSIEKQTFKDVLLHVSVDNDTAKEYATTILAESGLNHEIVPVTKPESGQAFYNEYLNNLLDNVKDGWIYIVDDDDFLLSPTVLADLHRQLTDTETMYLFRVMLNNSRLVPVDRLFGLNFVQFGQISMSGFSIHASQKDKSRFEKERGGDYRFINSLINILKIKWLDIVVLGTGNMGLRGAAIDIMTPVVGDIYYFKPFSLEKNIGKEYNKYMSLLPNDNDYGVLCDGDTMFIQDNWGNIISNVVNRNPDVVFTCLTNRVRIGSPQLVNGKISNDGNVGNHRKIAERLSKINGLKTVETKDNISGFFMVIPKSIWNKIRFDESKGILGVDWDYCEKLRKENIKIHVMHGLYMFHYYRLNEGIKHTKHLK